MKMSALLRSAIALAAVAVTAACTGSAPTSPSASLTASVSNSSAATDAQGGSLTGTAALNFHDFGGGVLGFESATENGQTGRIVQLTGNIVGINFEPGVCHAGVDPFAGLRCVLFGDGPGMFERYAPGGVAFTTCHCAVGGVGNPATDQVTLKISYPPAINQQYPQGFTKFTFQAGTGPLATLSGQGTLDFNTYPQASFTYRFNRS
jgi:hypothetical protein